MSKAVVQNRAIVLLKRKEGMLWLLTMDDDALGDEDEASGEINEKGGEVGGWDYVS